MVRCGVVLVLGILALLPWPGHAGADRPAVLKMAVTTSTQASGLLDVLVPAFEKDTGIQIRAVARGTGAALREGEDGNVDIVLVHARAREERFVKQGYGTKRYAVMHNDFVLVGPAGDPCQVAGSATVVEAFERVAAGQCMFVSRGDDSGTHGREQDIWKSSTVPCIEETREIIRQGAKRQVRSRRPADRSGWYLSVGQGMGRTLLLADEKQAYTLTDRGTYIKYTEGRDRPISLVILKQGDTMLNNPYSIIPVNPKVHPHVKHDLAMQLVRWITSAPGQELIASYRLHGKELFFPDALPLETGPQDGR